jgi:hypothetical protein
MALAAQEDLVAKLLWEQKVSIHMHILETACKV